MTEADSLTERSFHSLEMERAGTHLVPGKSVLPSDALVLLSLDKTQAELMARVQSWSWPRRGWCSVIVAESNTYVFFHRVPVGLEARSSLVGWSWLNDSHEVVIKLLAGLSHLKTRMGPEDPFPSSSTWLLVESLNFLPCGPAFMPWKLALPSAHGREERERKREVEATMFFKI